MQKLFYLSLVFLVIVGCGGEASFKDDDKLSENASGLSSLPNGFKEIRSIGIYGIQATGQYGLKENIIALFKDGTYTEDLSGIFSIGKGVAYSKRKKPKSWGQWRVNAKDEILLKDHNDKEFETTVMNFTTTAGGTNQKLNACYGRLVSSDGMGSGYTVGSSRSYCFKKDGRYALNSTGFVSAGQGYANDIAYTGGVVGGGHSSSKKGGWYRIDGHIIEFTEQSGKKERAAFMFLNKDKSHIAINGRRMMGREPLDVTLQSESTTSSQAKTKSKYVLIMSNVPTKVCKSASFKRSLQKKGLKKIDIQVKNNTITCADMGRKKNSKFCKIQTYKGKSKGTKACVIGFDR